MIPKRLSPKRRRIRRGENRRKKSVRNLTNILPKSLVSPQAFLRRVV
uniref:Uncharacterized protein n=1 Tax=Brassica campestris TaxID=3711 RepID=A0A3P6C2T4_BRACM|nr:unnamed protein product [Brassica rapa]